MPEPLFDLTLDRDDHGTPCVRLRGELDLAGAGRLEAFLEELPKRDSLVLDLRGLTFMDSTGVRVLLQEAEAAKHEGRSLRMLPPTGGEALVTIEETGIAALLPLDPPAAGRDGA